MSTTALTTADRSLVRRKRPNRPSVDNAFASSWCPHFGVRFIHIQSPWIEQTRIVLNKPVIPTLSFATINQVWRIAYFSRNPISG